MTAVALTVRSELAAAIGEARRRGLISAVEVVPSPFFTAGATDELRSRLREVDLPYSFHFIDSSVLSADFPTPGLMESRAQMLRQFEPMMVSEHFTAHRVGDLDFAANLPPIAHPSVCEVYAKNLAAFRAAWDLPPERVCFENVPTLYRHEASTEPEVSFFLSMAREYEFNVLLDLHNLYVDERAGLYDAATMVEQADPPRVQEIHVAGGKVLSGGTYVDGHCARVPERVFELLRRALQRCRPTLVVLEREHDFEDQVGLLEDLERINALVAEAA